MKTPSSSSSTTIIIIVVVVLAAGAYFFYQGKSTPVTGGLVAQDNSDIGFAEVRLLEQIRSVHIDRSLFDDAEFRALQDYSVAIPPQPIGRDNPFAPI